jgi:hypothetical protein
MSEELTDLSAFTQSLAEVRPNVGQLQRDAILFAAGVAAGRRGRFWPGFAAAMSLLAAGLGATLVFRPPTTVEVERIVVVQVATPQPAPGPDTAPKIDGENQPVIVDPSGPDWSEGLRQRESLLRGDGPTPSAVWAPFPPPGIPNPVPDLSSLRLNAKPKFGE